MPVDLILWGTALTPLLLAFVMLAQQLGLSDYWADWLRAALFGTATLLVLYQADIASAVPWLPDVVNNVLVAVGVFLSLKGLWPDLRGMWNRLVRGGEYTFSAAAYSDGRGRFW